MHVIASLLLHVHVTCLLHACKHTHSLGVHGHVVKAPRRYMLIYECEVFASTEWCQAEESSFIKCAPSCMVSSTEF